MNYQPDMSKIPGGCIATQPCPNLHQPADEDGDTETLRYRVGGPSRYAFMVRNLLDAYSCQQLRAHYEAQGTFAPVSIQGMAPGAEATEATSQVGSHRITCWDPAFGEKLWKVLKYYLEPVRTTTDLSLTDWWQDGKHRHWKPVGVSPMARYMRYDAGGQHYAHYDAGYIYLNDPNLRRTLMSGVLYLTTNKTGATCFVEDGQDKLSIWDRNHADWTEPVTEDQVSWKIPPREGSVLLFDHRHCHSVEPYDGAEGPRIIIRFDVIYEAVSQADGLRLL
jgi:hypothetical protein